MDVSAPVRVLTPTLDGPILIALAGTTAPLTLADLTRLLDPASKSGIRSSCLRLVAQGVVLQVPGGYVLNRDHLAWPAIEALANLRIELLRRIGLVADTWPTAPALLGVFGSFARRDGDELSDIDLLLVSPSPDVEAHASELAEHVRAWTGNSCNVMTLSPADIHRLHTNREKILEEWNRDLEVIRGSVDALRG